MTDISREAVEHLCEIHEGYEQYGTVATLLALRDALDRAETPILARHQPCGCVVCICGDEDRCHGCGSTHCHSHPVGEIPNPVYVDDPYTTARKAGWDDAMEAAESLYVNYDVDFNADIANKIRALPYKPQEE